MTPSAIPRTGLDDSETHVEDDVITLTRKVREALHSRAPESVDLLRRLEVDRLDTLQQATWARPVRS